MYCSNCGNKLNENKTCDHCNIKKETTFWWGLLGFFVPLVGLILFCMWNKTEHKKAVSSGIGALIGFIIKFVLIFLLIFFIVISFGFEENNKCDSYCTNGIYIESQNKCVCDGNIINIDNYDNHIY